MIYNVGSAVPITWVNPSGDLGPASITVTAPDGTTTTASGITSSPPGTYTYTYTTTQAGLHSYVWTTASTVDEGVFEVRPQSQTALISLDDARETLRLRSTDTADNAKIQNLIESASRLVLNITGPMATQTFEEWFDGGIATVSPSQVPFVKVLNAAEYYGLSKFVLTEQPLGNQTNAFAFTVDYITGQITRRTYGGAPAMFAIGSKNVWIQYQAGRLLVPENVQLATRELVRHIYQQTQVPGRPKFGQHGGAEDYAEIPIGFAIPRFVEELLIPDRRAPGVA